MCFNTFLITLKTDEITFRQRYHFQHKNGSLNYFLVFIYIHLLFLVIVYYNLLKLARFTKNNCYIWLFRHVRQLKIKKLNFKRFLFNFDKN